jgi:hypothetical protein
LQLRQAMLLNGLLYNSEAWHSVTRGGSYQKVKKEDILVAVTRLIGTCRKNTPNKK